MEGQTPYRSHAPGGMSARLAIGFDRQIAAGDVTLQRPLLTSAQFTTFHHAEM